VQEFPGLGVGRSRRRQEGSCLRALSLLARLVLLALTGTHSNEKEDPMNRTKRLLTGAVAAAAFIVPVAVGSANHIRIEAPPVSAPPTTVVVPVPAPTQTMQADEIKAGVVRANTIYANKIEADEVRGAVHQTRGVKVRDSQGKIKAPEVLASVIYADVISANTVEADTIYVRELDRH
jgi:hypothetical protein